MNAVSEWAETFATGDRKLIAVGSDNDIKKLGGEYESGRPQRPICDAGYMSPLPGQGNCLK